MGNYLPRCERVNPITHLHIQLSSLEPQIGLDVSCVIHFALLVTTSGHTSRTRMVVWRGLTPAPHNPPTGSSCVTTLGTTPRAVLNPRA